MSSLRIGELAKRTAVNIETIRYYERRGLLAPPPRSRSGYRLYQGDAVGRIAFIKRAKALGFTLTEISELLELRVDPGSGCEDIEARAQSTMERIECKIEELEKMRAALERLATACRTGQPTSACPIIEDLESPEA